MIKLTNFLNQTPHSKLDDTWQEENHVYQRDDLRYKRLLVEHKEDLKSKQLNHISTLCIDMQTGAIYLDCRRRKIFAKHLALCVGRPLYTIIKTLWHLTIIGPVVSIYIKFRAKKIDIKTAQVQLTQSFLDIVRVPLYGIAMTITHIAALI